MVTLDRPRGLPREGQLDGEEAILVGRIGGLGVDGLVQLHVPLEDAVIDLDVLIQALLAGRAASPSANDEDTFDDRHVDLGRVDPGELDDDRDRGRVVRPVDVERRTKAGATRDEARNLAQIREQLLHLGLHAVDVPASGHETIVPMPRIFKSAPFMLGVLGYLWVAGVRNLDEVKERKLARRAR